MKKKSFKAFAGVLIVYVFVHMYISIALSGPESMNIILPALENLHGWNPAEIVSKLSMVRLSGVVTGAIIGTIIMKVGVKKLFVPATILTGIFTILMSNTQTVTQFVLCQAIIAVVGPALMIGQNAFIANWFVKNKGKVLGIVTIAAPLSTATFIPTAHKLLETIGFSGLYTGMGLIFIVLGILAAILIKDNPEEIGSYPDGQPVTAEELGKIKLMEESAPQWTFSRVIKNKEIWFYCIGWSFINLVHLALMSQFIPVVTSGGLDIKVALTMFSAAAIIGIPLSVLWGWIDDKLGTPKTCTIFAFITIIGALGFAYGSNDNMALYYLGSLAIAMNAGAIPNLMPSHLMHIFGRKEFINVNRYWMVCQSIVMSLVISYVPVMYSIFGDYKPVFLMLIPLSIIAGVVFKLTDKTYDPEKIITKQKDSLGA